VLQVQCVVELHCTVYCSVLRVLQVQGVVELQHVMEESQLEVESAGKKLLKRDDQLRKLQTRLTESEAERAREHKELLAAEDELKRLQEQFDSQRPGSSSVMGTSLLPPGVGDGGRVTPLDAVVQRLDLDSQSRELPFKSCAAFSYLGQVQSLNVALKFGQLYE